MDANVTFELVKDTKREGVYWIERCQLPVDEFHTFPEGEDLVTHVLTLGNLHCQSPIWSDSNIHTALDCASSIEYGAVSGSTTAQVFQYTGSMCFRRADMVDNLFEIKFMWYYDRHNSKNSNVRPTLIQFFSDFSLVAEYFKETNVMICTEAALKLWHRAMLEHMDRILQRYSYRTQVGAVVAEEITRTDWDVLD